jgi:hypothetical protein
MALENQKNVDTLMNQDIDYSALGNNPTCDKCGKYIQPFEGVVQSFVGVTEFVPTSEFDIQPPEMAVFYDKMMLVHVECQD